jgi:DNA-binding LacI/PurR family transcriptional regulator
MLFSALYQACAEQNLVQGRDFMLAGLCSGGTLSNLSPAPSYLKIPHYDLGVVCLDAALNTTPQIIEVNATLIENSTLTSKPLALKI